MVKYRYSWPSNASAAGLKILGVLLVDSEAIVGLSFELAIMHHNQSLNMLDDTETRATKTNSNEVESLDLGLGEYFSKLVLRITGVIGLDIKKVAFCVGEP